MTRLLLATHNRHKTEEVAAILAQDFEVSDLTTAPKFSEPEETGATFQENAAIKALAASKVAGPDVWVLADDSGLEVDALNGAPGVHSARYAGIHGDNAANRARLLLEMKDQPRRHARFRCILALARNNEIEATFTGSVEGEILDDERGSGGFGYDSLFQPQGFQESFAELPPEIKNSLSHRGRALADFLRWWQEHKR